MKYTKVNTAIIAELKNIVGQEHVITDKDALENYAHDETPLYHTLPDVVVKPGSTAEVAQTMKLASKYVIPVTPRSGGTSLSAGAVPAHGGIVLSLERMNRIKEIDTQNLMAVVEPGIITEQLGIELAKQNLFFPPDPVSLDSCMIGGNVAECAGGPRAMKYGVTKHYVLGLEAVLPTGDIIRIGGKLLKNVTGYDLLDLIVGSEGTLAIVTEATLRLLPLPRIVVALLVPFKCTEDAVGFTTDVLKIDCLPAAVEFMEGDVYRLAGEYLKRKLPFSEADAHIIVELDGNDTSLLKQQYDRIGDIALKHGALDVFVAESAKDKERVWEPRKKTSDALKTLTNPVAREDLVVPKDKVPVLLERLKECAGKYQARLFAFGHLGDGNIHADFAYPQGKAVSSDQLERMRTEVYEITLKLGGAITAEHGVGLSKIRYLEMALSKTELEIMKHIKKLFDPQNILNPGKIFTTL